MGAALDESSGGRLLGRLASLVSPDETDQLRLRLDLLERERRFPAPPSGWRAVPWPLF